MKRILGLYFMTSISILLTGQNLITNPDFEICQNCNSSGYVEFSYTNGANKPIDWFGASPGSSDIRSTNPRSGRRHGGFFSFGKYEYLANTLTQTLKPGAVYQMSFYLKADVSSGYALDEIGVAFHSGQPKYAQFGPLNQLKLAYTSPNNEYTNPNQYQKYTFEYTACGDEDHLIIGCFKDLGEGDTLFIGGAKGRPGIIYPYTFIDDVELVSIKDAPELLSSNITLCPGKSNKIVLPNKSLLKKIIWSDGSTGTEYDIKSNDEIVWVSVQYNESCPEIRDTIQIIRPTPYVDLFPKDTFICEGSDIELKIEGQFTSIPKWNTQDTGNRIIINQAGIYSFTTSDVCGVIEDTIEVRLVKESDNLVLADSICFTKDLTIFIDSSIYSQVLWSDGQSSWAFRPKSAGTYTVKAQKLCTITDKIVLLDQLNLDELVQVPNLFTPNGDMVNDEFKPVIMKLDPNKILSYDFQVFNRWGKKVFGSGIVSEVWKPNEQAPIDSYIYNLEMRVQNCTNDELVIRKGSVSLIR